MQDWTLDACPYGVNGAFKQLKWLYMESSVCCMWHRFMDGRVWPQEDEKQVMLMMALIHHCTGEPSQPLTSAWHPSAV